MQRFLLVLVTFNFFQQSKAQPSKAYLMAYHTCSSSSSCSNPSNHTVQLAESSNGSSWTSVPGYSTISNSGSVPDVITRGDKLYLYSTSGVRRYTKSTNTWETTTTSISVKEATGSNVNYVDPSLIIDESGNLVLFFLESGGPGTGDPAGCSSYPCTKNFKSATEVSGSDGTQFIVNTGTRLAINLTANTASDPDIYYDGTRYILYISSGTNTLAYTSATLHGSYTVVSTLSNGVLTSDGGIGSGYYDPITEKYWTYVHNNSGEIKQAIHAAISSKISGFTTVINFATAGLAAGSLAQSPGICKNELTTSGGGGVVVPCATLPPAPTVADLVYCTGASTIALSATAASGNTLLWYGTNAIGGTGSTTAPTPSANTASSIDYYVTQVTTASGCESIRSKINVTVKTTPGKPVITRDANNNLVSNTTNGNQWYTDTTGIISGQSAQLYRPSLAGYYSLKITQNGCNSIFADKYYYLVTSLVNFINGQFIKLYPNPVKNELMLQFQLTSQNQVTVKVFDVNGILQIQKNNMTNGSLINTSLLSKGIYLIQVNDKYGKTIFSDKLIKE